MLRSQTIVAVLLSLATVGAFAKDRRTRYPEKHLDATRSTCRSLQKEIVHNGAAILFFENDTYDRYVADDSFCFSGFIAKSAAIVKTKDNPKCWIGYRCTNI